MKKEKSTQFARDEPDGKTTAIRRTAVREAGVSLHQVGPVNPFFPTVPTFAVRETASVGIMGAPREPLLNPSETIVLSEHYRL